jgi:hypothetical protein
MAPFESKWILRFAQNDKLPAGIGRDAPTFSIEIAIVKR